jgi:phosphatidate cytidylyltransferase
MASNLTQRIAFAAVAIPLALGVVWFGSWPLVAVIATAAVLGARELCDFAARQGIDPLRRTGLISAAVAPAYVYLAVTSSPGLAGWSWFLAALWLIGVLSLALFRRRSDQRPLAATAVTVLVVLYTGGLPASLVGIRHLTQGDRSWVGAWLVFTPLVITWICDTAAMFVGKTVGGPRLWAAVSPGKTWSGTIGGVAGALVTAPLLKLAVLDRLGLGLPLGQALLFALVLGVVGQVGDLAESLFKREAGVKDSSGLIPGHGGVLDRFDSLYFVLPAAAAMYRCFGVI